MLIVIWDHERDENEWKTLCDRKFTFENANVACKSMGFSSALNFTVDRNRSLKLLNLIFYICISKRSKAIDNDNFGKFHIINYWYYIKAGALCLADRTTLKA